jgi:hypothetical protein
MKTSTVGSAWAFGPVSQALGASDPAPPGEPEHSWQWSWLELEKLYLAIPDFLAAISSYEGQPSSVNRGAASDSPPHPYLSEPWIYNTAPDWGFPSSLLLEEMTVQQVIDLQKGGLHKDLVYGWLPGEDKALAGETKEQAGFLAVGKYQLTQQLGPDKTIIGRSNILVNTGYRSLESITFDEDTQNRFAAEIICGGVKRPTLTAYIMGGAIEAGGYTDDVDAPWLEDSDENVERAAQDVALEWASWPLMFGYEGCSRGQSAYCGYSNYSGRNAAAIGEDEAIEYIRNARNDMANNPAVTSMLSDRAAASLVATSVPDPSDPIL